MSRIMLALSNVTILEHYCTCVCVYMYVLVCLQACLQVCLPMYVPAYMCVCVYVYVHVCLYVCMSVRVLAPRCDTKQTFLISACRVNFPCTLRILRSCVRACVRACVRVCMMNVF